jgi:uncharacterized protein (TIGR03083 family)
VTVAAEQLGEAIDARPLMRAVRARLDALVADLDDADWRRATVCPGWDVADLVAHLVGDDLGRLSRTHDGAAGPPRRPGEDLPAYLDRINEEWVVAFRRLSPAVLVSLLGAGGGEVLALWDDAIERDDLVGAVSWAGLEVGVGWMDHARDTTEYWIHEQQLREAVGRPHVDADEVAAVVDVLARGLPHALEALEAPEGAHVEVRADDLGLAWRVERRDGRWWFAGHRPAAADEAAPPPFAAVGGTGDAYWRRWSRHPAGGRGAFSASGDAAAGAAVVDHVAVIRAPD